MEKLVPYKSLFLRRFELNQLRVSFLLLFAIFNFSVAWGQNMPQVYEIKVIGQTNQPVNAAKITYSENNKDYTSVQTFDKSRVDSILRDNKLNKLLNGL